MRHVAKFHKLPATPVAKQVEFRFTATKRMPETETPIRDLLHLCLSSEGQEHWREFVRRTQPLIAAVIIHTVRRWKEPAPSLVDDLIQDTYVKLFANDRKALRGIKNEFENAIFGYLKVVASNVVKDFFRRPETQAEEVELSDPILPPAPDNEERLEFARRKDQVGAVLETLSASETHLRDVSIFWFYYQDGYTAREISLIQAVGLTVKGVEAVLLRLTRYVREKLGLADNDDEKKDGMSG